MMAILAWLSIFAASVVLLTISLIGPLAGMQSWPQPGPALLFLFTMFTLLAVVMIGRQFKAQHNQITQVLKSLINHDTSLRLSSAPEVQGLLSEVQAEIGRSRDAAEIQANYFKALIAQLDIAVLELTDDNHIEQSNPAAERLLGLSFIQAWQSQFAGHKGLTSANLTATPHDSLQTHTQRNIDSMRQLVQQHQSHRGGEITWYFPNRKETFIYTLIHSFIQGKQRTLITLQSIEKQLVAYEVKAHQQLVKVLTHEVANSITPMVSLTQSAQGIGADMLNKGVEGSEDLVEALATVSRRGQHLTQFIHSFKAISTPVKAQLQVQPLLSQVEEVLLVMQADCNGVDLAIDIDPLFDVMIDPPLFEQILINLIKNACEATRGQAVRQLTLIAQHIDQTPCLDIIDNGPGISEQAATSLFVPFFTTKTSGTGIGLPLARALMLSQGGNLLLLNSNQHGHFRCVFG